MSTSSNAAAALSASADAAASALSSVSSSAWLLALGLIASTVLFVVARRYTQSGADAQPLLARGLEAPSPASARSLWILVALLALAAVLRLRALGQGLSFDEIDTLVHYARRPLAQIATTFDSQNQHLLYSLCARVAVLVFDDEAFAVRLPAVVFGVASIWALFHFARLVTGEREATAACALLTVSYHHLWFSQNARGYTGLLFFTLLGSASFLEMLRAREPRGLAQPITYGVCMALGALTHATAVISVVAHFAIWLALVVRPRSRAAGANRWQPFWGFAFAASITFTLYAWVLPQFVETLLAPTLPGKATEWKDPLWLARELLDGLARGVPGGMPLIGIGAVLALVGVVSYARQGLAVLATFLLGAALMAGALIATHHNLWPRMFFFVAGFAVLIALRGVAESVRFLVRKRSSTRARAWTTAAFVLACVASAASLRFVWAPKQDFEGALAFLEAEQREGDAVVTVGMTTLPYTELYGKNWPAVDNADALASLEALHRRTWIVYTTPTHMQAAFPDVWKRVRESYREAGVFWGTLAGCEVLVSVRGG